VDDQQDEAFVKEELESPPPGYVSEIRAPANSRILGSHAEEDPEEGELADLDDEESSIYATGLPSPTDTEPIDEWLLPRARCLPRAPVMLRGSHYQQACDDFVDERSCMSKIEAYHFPCFRPHIVALMRERVLYPFVETNRPGPVTDTTVPIRDRKYYPHPDIDIHYNIIRVKRVIKVDYAQ
jgi:hypothetical protein